MEKNIKQEIKYIIVNVILLLISSILIAYICILLKDVVGSKHSVNEINSNFEIDYINNIETAEAIENKEIIIPEVIIDAKNKEEYDFNKIKNNKYYYNQLNNNSKTIYELIEKNLNNMKSGTYEITLPDSIANVLKSQGGEETLNKSFQSAWDAISLDRMDIFFMDISKISLNIKKTTYGNNVSYSLTMVPNSKAGYLANGFTDKKSVDFALNQVKNTRDTIINNLSGDTYSKVLQVHDWIISNFDYSLDTQNTNIYNIYGGLIEKSAVCEGYAETLKYILDELEIPCIIISGTATNSEGKTEKHAWNYVQINEKWYAVDTTWDDPIVKGLGIITNATKHKYFLQGSKTMNENHIPEGRITSVGQEFIYPDLEQTSYKK